MLDRFQGMQVLLKAVELGNLSAAARALKMSPTMATKHIAAQEARLGVRLLHRTTRRVTLTEAGRTYFDAAERIVGEVQEAEETTSADHVTVRGMLRVNAPVSFGIREIAPLMAEFSKLHPSLIVDLGLNDRMVDLVDEGWDMAVRIGRIASSTMVLRKLAPCRMILCASPDYIRRHGRPTKVADLADHECLGYTLSRDVGPEIWSFTESGAVSVHIHGHLRASNGDALLEAAIAGQGLTYQPTFILGKAILAGQLVAIELEHPPLVLGGIFAVHPPNDRLPAKVRVFTEFLAERFSGIPPWDARIADMR
jgi:DNA-binding transcriptional LysR family regulator